jgi:NTE family protein
MKIGLALGGGAGKGLAHIGVLQVLEEQRIPIHLICGTSIGAVIGGIYAIKKDTELLEQEARDFLKTKVFQDMGFELFKKEKSPSLFRNLTTFIREKYLYTKGLLHPYLIHGEKYRTMLTDIFGNTTNEDVKIPFAAVSTDLITGKDCILSKGPLVDMILPSISIPGLFPYVDYENKLLVDGGATADIPVYATKSMGADFVIAVSFIGKIKEEPSLKTGIDIALRVDRIAKHRLHERELKEADVIISPDVHSIHWADFGSIDFCIQKGRDAAYKSLPELRKKLGPWYRIRNKISKYLNI